MQNNFRSGQLPALANENERSYRTITGNSRVCSTQTKQIGELTERILTNESNVQNVCQKIYAFFKRPFSSVRYGLAVYEVEHKKYESFERMMINTPTRRISHDGKPKRKIVLQIY